MITRKGSAVPKFLARLLGLIDRRNQSRIAKKKRIRREPRICNLSDMEEASTTEDIRIYHQRRAVE